jgi:autotransporter-associated beta strand protein
MQLHAGVSSSRKKRPFILAALIVAAAPRLFAATAFWDIDGVIPGAGGPTPSGTWDALLANWSLDATGAAATQVWTTGDTAVFSAGTDATGAYTVTVSGTQTAGGLTVEEGLVSIAVGAVAVGAGAITIGPGATLITDTSARVTTTAGSVLTLNGGTLRSTNPGAAGTFFDTDSLIILGSAGGTFSYTTANTLNIVQTASVIQGAGSLTKTGAGVLAIAGTGSYTGPTIVNDGEFRIRGAANRLPITTAVTVTSPGILNLNGLGQQIGSLTGTGSVGLANGTLTVGDATNTSFTGVIADTANGGAGGATAIGGKLTKVGAGTLTLTGNNTYTGLTTVTGGTLVAGVNGSLGTGSVTVQSTAIKLTIQTGVVSAIGDSATLTLAGGGTAGSADAGFVDLGAGVNETVGALVLGSLPQGPGTYGSTLSPAAFTDNEYFGGTGIVTVIPEPGGASMLLGGFSALLGLQRFRRRR